MAAPNFFASTYFGKARLSWIRKLLHYVRASIEPDTVAWHLRQQVSIQFERHSCCSQPFPLYTSTCPRMTSCHSISHETVQLSPDILRRNISKKMWSRKSRWVHRASIPLRHYNPDPWSLNWQVVIFLDHCKAFIIDKRIDKYTDHIIVVCNAVTCAFSTNTQEDRAIGVSEIVRKFIEPLLELTTVLQHNDDHEQRSNCGLRNHTISNFPFISLASL